MSQGAAPIGSLGGWSTTLAHEAAHVILHRRLIDVPQTQESLFALCTKAEAETAITQCFERNIWFARATSDWKEVQANLGMASLLKPSSLFPSMTQEIVGTQAVGDLLAYIPAFDSRAFSDLTRQLSVLCQVSREAARIRLNTVGLARSSSESISALDVGPQGGAMIRLEQVRYCTGVVIHSNAGGLS